MSDALPAVKQCHLIGHPQFGSVAVKTADDRWGVMNPNNGGHWSTSAEVAGWADMAPPEPKAPPTPEPPPNNQG